MNALSFRRRTALGILLLLSTLTAAGAAVLLGAANTTIGLDPEGHKYSVEITLAAALCLGYALGAAVEGWVRGDSIRDWSEAFVYRFAGAFFLFALIVAAVAALEGAGIGPQNL